jgi:5-hydroxyisourate hydrolase
MPSMISTQIIDWIYGRPAVGVPVFLEKGDDHGWVGVMRGVTGADGFIGSSGNARLALSRGVYRLTCDINSYFAALGTGCFYHEFTLTFAVADSTQFSEQTFAVSPHGCVSFVMRGTSE